MKRSIRYVLAMLVSVVALSTLSLAQADSYRLNVNIPFDFYAGNQQLPAGNYRFEVSYQNHAVTLQNRETGRSYTMLAIPSDGENTGTAYVEFYVLGAEHQLADLKTADAGVDFAKQRTSSDMASNADKVAIVATLR
jgi:hypothetical protein